MFGFKKKPTKKWGRKKKKALHAKAWRVWSTYRRRTAADHAGYVTCYTCGKRIRWQEANLGHLKHGKLDFHPLNTEIQCVGCNLYKHGCLDIYMQKKVESLGIEAMKALTLLSNTHPGYSEDELRHVINTFK